MNKIKLTLLSLIILIAVGLSAQNNFMWEIKGGESSMFLLGSIHMMPEDAYPLNSIIEESFKKSDVLVIEADPTSVDPQKIQQIVVAKGFYPQDQSLKDNIDPELYARVETQFTKFGLPAAQIQRYKPWFVSLNLEMLQLQTANVKATLGVDLHFINAAKAKKMPIIELESGIEQVELLYSFPEDSQEEYLRYSLDNFESVEDYFAELLKAWQDGDAKKMNKATRLKMQKQMKELPAIKTLYDNLFTNRDEKMAEKLDLMLKDTENKTYFIVVGSGHLIGDDGLLKRLEQKGYKTIQK